MLIKWKDQGQNFRSIQRIRKVVLPTPPPKFPLISLGYEFCWDPVVYPAEKNINLSCCPFSQARNMILLLHYWAIMKIVLLHVFISSSLFFHQNRTVPFFLRHDRFCLPFDHIVRNCFITANWLITLLSEKSETRCQLSLCLWSFNELNMSLKLTSIILIQLQ